MVWVECYYVKKIAQRHGPHGDTETGAHQGNNLTHNENEEEFIVSWARELPTDQPLKIIVHLPDAQASRPEAKELGAAITRYFNYRAHIVTLDLKELFRVGRRALAIGATVLSFSVLAGRAVANIAPGPVAQVVEESLLIFGWVANWRPIEIFLYEWWPIVRRRNLYRRLAAAEVDLTPFKDERLELGSDPALPPER